MQMNANQLTKIPVEKLSNTLRFLIAENEIPFSDALKQVIDDVDAVCKKLLRDESAPAQPVSEPYKLNGWISVDEKMPEATRKDQYFITHRRPNKDFKSVTGGFFIDLFRKGCFAFSGVTHWMPLPAAPAQDDKSASTELPNHSELSTNSPVIPDGWKLVPIEPTAEMAQAARDCHESESFLPYSIYRAMLAAAPAQEQK